MSEREKKAADKRKKDAWEAKKKGHAKAALVAAPLAATMPFQEVLQKKADSVVKTVKDAVANRKADTKRLEQKWADLVAKKDKERVQQSIKNRSRGRPAGSTTSTSSRGSTGGGVGGFGKFSTINRASRSGSKLKLPLKDFLSSGGRVKAYGMKRGGSPVCRGMGKATQGGKFTVS